MPEDEEKYKVRFADETKKEFRKLGHAARVDILATIKKKLTTKPEEFVSWAVFRLRHREHGPIRYIRSGDPAVIRLDRPIACRNLRLCGRTLHV